MSFTQLNPPIPVQVIGKGKGFAFGVIDYGIEHNLLWVTAIDETGEIWCAPNPIVRMQANWSAGRKSPKLPVGLNETLANSCDGGSVRGGAHVTSQPEVPAE